MSLDDVRYMNNICSMDKLAHDIDGAVLNFDEEYYDSSGVNMLVKAFVNYFSNLTIIKTNVSTTQSVDSQVLYEEEEDSLRGLINTAANNSELTTNQIIYDSMMEYLRHLSHLRDITLNSQLMFQNGLIVCAYSLLIVVSLFGNLLVLYSILSRQHIRAQATNKLIANLIFSDLLLSTFTIPLTIVRILFDSWPLGSVLCQLGPLVQAQSVYVSTITMVVISLDRQQHLLGSLSKRLRSSTLANLRTILFIWLLSTLLSIPHFIFNRAVYRQSYTCIVRCQAIYPKPAQYYSRAITVLTVATQYLIPLTILAICYTKIGVHIWRQADIGDMTCSQRVCQHQARKRTIKMLILVVIVFAICWLPLNLYHICLEFIPETAYSRSFFILCHWFGMSFVCYNPFIYFWLNKQYKERAVAILKMCHLNKCCYCLPSNVWEASSPDNSSNLHGDQIKMET